MNYPNHTEELREALAVLEKLRPAVKASRRLIGTVLMPDSLPNSFKFKLLVELSAQELRALLAAVQAFEAFDKRRKKTFQNLLDRSSLGTPGAKAIMAKASKRLVRKTLKRADKLARKRCS